MHYHEAVAAMHMGEKVALPCMPDKSWFEWWPDSGRIVWHTQSGQYVPLDDNCITGAAKLADDWVIKKVKNNCGLWRN